MSEHLSPVEAARRLGVTIKALKTYERHGLVTPHRLANGWRTYGPEQILRVNEVLALKAMGLSLSRIATLLDGKSVDLIRTLDLQERLLRERRATAERAIKLLAQVRSRLEAGQAPDIADLLNLARAGAAAPQTWGPLILKYYEQHLGTAALAKLDHSGSEVWSALIAELKAMVAAGDDPSSPAAVDFLRRWLAAARRVVRGDIRLYEGAQQAWEAALDDPSTGPSLPLGREHIAYLGRIGPADALL